MKTHIKHSRTWHSKTFVLLTRFTPFHKTTRIPQNCNSKNYSRTWIAYSKKNQTNKNNKNNNKKSLTIDNKNSSVGVICLTYFGSVVLSRSKYIKAMIKEHGLTSSLSTVTWWRRFKEYPLCVSEKRSAAYSASGLLISRSSSIMPSHPKYNVFLIRLISSSCAIT